MKTKEELWGLWPRCPISVYPFFCVLKSKYNFICLSLYIPIEYAKSSLVDLFPLSTINFYFGLHDFGRICDPLNGSIPHRVYWK